MSIVEVIKHHRDIHDSLPTGERIICPRRSPSPSPSEADRHKTNNLCSSPLGLKKLDIEKELQLPRVDSTSASPLRPSSASITSFFPWVCSSAHTPPLGLSTAVASEKTS
ncbi:hypothetical protein CVT26_011070 [Gymnopilus dilepis]|uniref:Uncharacterized protein n=1 Tax=Gymnopilus dilepis TaxID=231916 RepID=A0A409VIX3_9AGAR|nr:hypothetical protein CVT26_011070 [Gymnopilus dilepis]